MHTNVSMLSIIAANGNGTGFASALVEQSVNMAPITE